MQSRFDFVFSYWVFVWFLLYHFKIVSYNPKFALVVALFANIIKLFTMIYYKNSFIYIVLFILIQLCIKIYPLWTLRNMPVGIPEIVSTMIVFIMFNFWLWLNNESIIELTKKGHDAVKKNKINTPLIYSIDKYVTRI
uniref:Uncharacterized protein n=1 Tax=viral metagenome TaxID=1070528 RepID=A0A6C0CUZ0_9ZZZZ